MSLRTTLARTFGSALKAAGSWISSQGGKVAIGIRYALSTGTPGRWASDHREESMHYTGWNYVYIHALAQQAAQADVAVFQDDTKDPQATAAKRAMRKSLRRMGKAYIHDTVSGTQLPPDHRLVKLLKRPNPSQSGASFRYEQVMQIRLTGTCLVYNVKNSLGLPVERYVIPTCMAYPVPESRELPRGGFRIDGTMNRFNMAMDSQGFSEMQGMFRAMGYVIPAEEMQVIRYPHPIWKDDGYGPLAAGALWSDTAEQMDQSRWANLKQGPNPSVIITVPEEMKNITEEELDAVSEKFNQKYGGPSNSGKAAFVTGGEIKDVSHTGREMDFANTWPQSRDCMGALHGTPGVAVGMSAEGSHAAFYVGMKQYQRITVQPVFDLLCESDTEFLLPYFGEGLTEEWQPEAFDDPELQEKQIATDLTAGILEKDELRVMRGLKPWGDARGKEIAGPPAPPKPGEAGAPGADGKPKPAAKPAAAPAPDDSDEIDDSDAQTTGLPTGIPHAPKSLGHGGKHLLNGVGHVNRIKSWQQDPVLKAAFEGALEEAQSDDEALEILGFDRSAPDHAQRKQQEEEILSLKRELAAVKKSRQQEAERAAEQVAIENAKPVVPQHVTNVIIPKGKSVKQTVVERDSHGLMHRATTYEKGVDYETGAPKILKQTTVERDENGLVTRAITHENEDES